jgi:hypothetical protein
LREGCTTPTTAQWQEMLSSSFLRIASGRDLLGFEELR